MSDYRDEQIERDQREREQRERQEEQRRGHGSPSPHQSEGGSSMRWEWNLSGPGSFSVSRVLATVYRPGGVYAIIGIIAGFILTAVVALVLVIGGGTSGGVTSESEGSGWGAVAFLLLGVVFLLAI